MKKIFKYILITILLILKTNCWATWTNFYFWNGTPLTAKFNTIAKGLSGKNLTKGKHYEIHATEVPPFTRGLILKVRRDKLPDRWFKKTTFEFTTKVSLYNSNKKKIGNNKPFEFKTYLRSSPRGILIPPSTLKNQAFIGNWEFKKNSLGTLSWFFDSKYENIDYKNREVLFYYDSYLRGLFHDQEYAISMRPLSGAKFDTNKNTLRVLAFNLWMRPLIIKPFDGQVERARMIPDIISGMFKDYLPDVIVFNEVFEPLTHNVLKKGMIAKGYKYYTKIVGSGSIGKTIGGHLKTCNGGVKIFSKYPIIKTAEMVFTDYSGPDGWAAKGIMYAQINKNGKIYNIFGTHLNAGGSDIAKNDTIREKQILDLRDLIKNLNIPKDQPVIIVGDLNVKKFGYYKDKNLFERYKREKGSPLFKKMLTSLNAVHPPHDLNWTTPHKIYLDYILYDKGYEIPKQSFNKPIGYSMYTVTPWIKWEGSLLKQIKNLKSIFGKNHSIRFHSTDHYALYAVFNF